jgi:tetratricopeptide (TPR) repeat protein
MFVRARRLPVPMLALALCGLSLAGWEARASLPRWMQDAIGSSAIEAALYRTMEIPGVKALYARPPKEAEVELGALIAKSPSQPDLYSLRAMEEEQALDFAAAEADWKRYASESKDRTGAELELADYYHRRLDATQEWKTLMEVGSAHAMASDQYVNAPEQRSWRAFERILPLAADQALDDEIVLRTYTAWIERYPNQPSLYGREFHWLLYQCKNSKRFQRADALIGQYRRAFPKDSVFPLKASALLELKRGSVEKALAIYDAGFEPLWPAELVQSYYALLTETHSQRRFVDDARAQLAKNPDDLKAMARLFYFSQQQGNLGAAKEVVEGYRISKESRNAKWNAQELYTLARLMEAVQAYPEAARYDFALYHAQGTVSSGSSAREEGLTGIVRILLTAPDQPVELGANNLSLYRDIATVDRGPGYWNGILSLWLNSESPEQSYHDEEQRAQPYFHRAKAAQLLTSLDREFPKAPARAELHKELIGTYADYGESALVVKEGGEFLASFTSSADETNRVLVTMYMADAYARQRDTQDEFALYDRMLTELGTKTEGMPLTAAQASEHRTSAPNGHDVRPSGDAVQPDADGADTQNGSGTQDNRKVAASRAFEVGSNEPVGIYVAGAQEYRQLLERYVGRLVANGQMAQALAVLRKELDRNPNDPLLYERLADFLAQNDLSAQQEEVYNQAIQKFQDKSWYDKLARLYLREKKRQAFADLTRKVTDIFAGTDLEAYFSKVNGGGPQLYLQLNLYAHQRFPHDQVFVEHLLGAYQTKATYDQAAWEKLLREHWSDSEGLRQRFFDYLSSNGKLDAELAQLRTLVPDTRERKENPNAARELAQVELWRSHFEESAPLLDSLAASYPADEEIGAQASSVFRSLAYYDTSETEHAVSIEKHLLAANPGSMDRLARIGDIYADSGADTSPGHENIAAAAPYWRRMPMIHPGSPDGYLQAATIFWDYYQFDDAMSEIHEARTKFGQPALFGYEAGAIDEGKRDMEGAVREYVGAATRPNGSADEASASRLLQLARRKATAKMVDEETTRALDAGESIAALELRERILEAQRRTPEIGPLLETALARAKTLDQAQAIGAQAQAHSLPMLFELALQKEVELASDPAQKIQITYELARSYESRKDLVDASRLIDAVYRENSKLLGVVRTTVDYDWRNQQQAKAINILLASSEAAKSMQPELSRQFVVEAASKANDSGNYAQARSLMAPLMTPLVAPSTGQANGSSTSPEADAYNAQYLSVVADSFARAGDDAGLKQFYLEKLAAIRTTAAAMTPDERKQKIALLRRGLIPALTRMKDYAGAVDQYIALLSAYPEDAGTTQEASLYALRYSRQQQLVDFVNATVKASPRDSRFAIMLAQIDTIFENYPAAIDAYAHAITIRADREDVFTAKADLEMRLQRLDDACKEYARLYVLSYQNPEWMVKIAAVRARQGRKHDAVMALERAWIEGHAATATDFFRVATQLESWGLLDESLHYAELGVKREGDALLAGSDSHNREIDEPQGAEIYARLLTRMRQQEKALAVLDAARAAAARSPYAPGVVIEQVEKQGLASVSDAQWRRRHIQIHVQLADQRYRGALMEMGKTVDTYFAPEEKAKFALLVDARWNATRSTTSSDHLQWIDVAHAAGVLDEEAQMRKQEMLDPAFRRVSPASHQVQPFIQLERSRMKYAELAEALDQYLYTSNSTGGDGIRIEEADAYRSAGDEMAELKTLRKIDFEHNANLGDRERYFALLLKYDVPALESFGKRSDQEEIALAAANYAVAHSDVKVARAAMSSHAADYPGQWENAYASLLGLYFRDLTPGTEASFHNLLGDQQTIAQRIQSHLRSEEDTESIASQPIAGGVWFYYGMRYGVYRTLSPRKDWPTRNPEDFLAAGLERNPSAANYAALARAYASSGDVDPALTEYRHALELAPDSPAIHDAMALLLWDAGRKDEAVSEWRMALTALNHILNKGPAPEGFWSSFTQIAQHLSSRKLTSALHPEMDSLLRGYLKINGNYRSDELLQAAFEASVSPSEGLAWILSLSTAANNPLAVLTSLDAAAWLPVAQREPILLREIELARITTAKTELDDYARQRVEQLQKSLVLYYVAEKQDEKAESSLKQLTDQQRQDPDLLEAEIELAAREHRVDALLAGYRSDAANDQPAQRLQLLRNAAARLSAEGFNVDALALWEFVFERLQLNYDLMASDYMGLAKARLAVGNVAGAVELLRRMTRLPNDSNPGDVGADSSMGNYDHAATLLVETGHDPEALEFLTALSRGVPWNATYALRLAQAQLRTGKSKSEAVAALEAIAGNNPYGYSLRVAAALSMQGMMTNTAQLGSEELHLLAVGKPTPQQAQQPYFAAARIAAADALAAGESAQRGFLLRETLAIQPTGFAGNGFTMHAGFTNGDVALNLFEDEVAAGHNAAALPVLERLLAGGNNTADGDAYAGDEGTANGDATATEDISLAEALDTAVNPSASSQGDKAETLMELERVAPLPTAHPLTKEEKLHLAILIAQVYERTESPASALPYLKLGRYLEPDKALQSDLGRRIGRIEEALLLESKNAPRRPKIQKALNQSNVVQPRLTAAHAAHLEAQ